MFCLNILRSGSINSYKINFRWIICFAKQKGIDPETHHGRYAEAITKVDADQFSSGGREEEVAQMTIPNAKQVMQERVSDQWASKHQSHSEEVLCAENTCCNCFAQQVTAPSTCEHVVQSGEMCARIAATHHLVTRPVTPLQLLLQEFRYLQIR